MNDKIKHVIACFLITIIASIFVPVLSAMLIALAVGAGKEIWDKVSGRGTPDWADMGANLFGIALAVFALSLTGCAWRTMPEPVGHIPYMEAERVHYHVNSKIIGVPDKNTVLGDHWRQDMPTFGDCDDYVMSKRRMLLDAGHDPSLMRLLLSPGHITLLVKTDRGWYNFDNFWPIPRPHSLGDEQEVGVIADGKTYIPTVWGKTLRGFLDMPGWRRFCREHSNDPWC